MFPSRWTCVLPFCRTFKHGSNSHTLWFVPTSIWNSQWLPQLVLRGLLYFLGRLCLRSKYCDEKKSIVSVYIHRFWLVNSPPVTMASVYPVEHSAWTQEKVIKGTIQDLLWEEFIGHTITSRSDFAVQAGDPHRVHHQPLVGQAYFASVHLFQKARLRHLSAGISFPVTIPVGQGIPNDFVRAPPVHFETGK